MSLFKIRVLPLLIAVGSILSLPTAAQAGLITVRQPEGPVYGILVLTSAAGEVLAHGELIQTVKGAQVDSRLVFRFKDRSLFDEQVVFSQQKTFSLIRYQLVQRGPAFPTSSEVTFQRDTGQYRARIRDKPDAEEKLVEGRLEMPADLYNGMSSVLLKNLRAGETATGRLLALTPKARLVKMEYLAEGDDAFLVGPVTRQATRYRVKLEIGGMLGVLASIAGKELPDLRYWIAKSPIPAFVKFEGPFYLDGPTWRIQLSGPQWPDERKPAK